MPATDTDTDTIVSRTAADRDGNLRRATRKILIVDDQPLARKGLKLTIEGEDDLTVCCDCGCYEDVLNGLGERTPDLAIVDVSQSGGTGVEVVRRLHASNPHLPILVLSWHDDPMHAAHALRAGARGYLTRSDTEEVVVEAVRRLLDGGLYVSDALNEKLLLGLASDPDSLFMSPPEVLSKRELQVFELTGRGIGTSEIARRIKVSVKTVESYRHRIKAKLHLHSATELVQNAVRWVDGENAA